MKRLKEYFIINLGLLLVALQIYYIMMPHNIVSGGVSGFAIVINHILPGLSIGTLMLMMNLVLFIIGFIFIGFNFGAKTIYSSLALSGMVWLLEQLVPTSAPLTNDILTELIISSILCSLGLALVFSQNASTGGTDIIAKIINKYLDIEIGKSVLVADLLIVISSVFVFGIKLGMYGMLGVILNGLMIDYLMQSFNKNKEIVIISKYSDAIKDYIVTILGRGATIYSAKGAFTADEKQVIRTIMNRKEFIRLKKHIQSIDINAFVTVTDINATFGEGFIQL